MGPKLNRLFISSVETLSEKKNTFQILKIYNLVEKIKYLKRCHVRKLKAFNFNSKKYL